jgi:transposase-like protein
MAYPKEFQIAALEHVKKVGTIQAAIDFGVDPKTILRWNREHHIYKKQEMRKFTEEQKREILTYANEHSLTSAMREYNLDIYTILKWNEKLNIYKPTGHRAEATHKKKYEVPTNEKKQEVLDFVKKHGISKAVRAFNIPSSTIQTWNKKEQVYKARKHRTFTEAQKALIIEQAKKTSVSEAAKKYNLYNHQIHNWIKKTEKGDK